MATPTPSTIKAILDVGSYPTGTISSSNIYDFLRPRKIYPSIEIELSKPQGKSETHEKVLRGYTFQIHLYYKQIGIGSDEIVNIGLIEDQITVLLNAAVLGDHKITNESFSWARTNPDAAHPFFYVSTLSLIISRVEEFTSTPDGVLKFDKAGSVVDNPPGADHTYVNVYNTEISEGFRDVEEMVTSNPEGSHIPVRYATRFAGRFIGNIHITAADLGATGQMINHLKDIMSSGEKPECKFIYTNKDSKTPPNTITETLFMMIDEISRRYMTEDLTSYRILGKLMKPSTIIAT